MTFWNGILVLFIVWIAVYSIVERICKSAEQVAQFKALGMIASDGKGAGLETLKNIAERFNQESGK